MRKIIFGLTFIFLFGAVCFAQTGNTSSRIDVLLETETSLDARLQETLDVKKSRVGDRVVLKTTDTIRKNGKTIIEKGTRLIGKITEIQQRTKDSTSSKIGLIFDKIEGKNLSAPIHASIVAITNISNDTAAGDVFESDASARTNNSGGVATGNSGGGGLLGSAAQTVGGVLGSTTQTVGGVMNTAGRTVSGATNSVGTAIKGLQISQTASGSANSSTTLSSSDKNLKIEKGANFRIQLNKAGEN